MQFQRGNIGAFFRGDPTLQLWMPFEDGGGTVARDLSGKGNNGTNTDIIYLPINERLGKGVKFNGTSSKVSIPNGTVGISGGEITISAFINFPPREAVYKGIIAKLADQSNCFSYMVQEPPYSTAPWYTLPWGSNTTAYNSSLQFIFSTTGSNIYYLTARVVLTGLHYITCVLKSGSGIFIYVDGKLIESSLSTTTFSIYNNATNPLYLGYRQDTGSYWSGLLDEVAIFSRALSSQEIFRYYKWATGVAKRKYIFAPSVPEPNFFPFF